MEVTASLLPLFKSGAEFADKGSPMMKTSRQQRLYEMLRHAMLTGDIAAGTRLPSSRSLAEDLGVARNSVLYAYERLSDEGFILADRRGSIVATLRLPRRAGDSRSDDSMGCSTKSGVNDLASGTLSAADTARVAAGLSKRAAGLRRRRLFARSNATASFLPGTPALDLFPLAQWRAALERAWRRVGHADLAYGPIEGQPRLREAIAQYLRMSRGVRCVAEQVFITDGTQGSLSLCANLLADPGERVWIEDPGYSGARAAFQAASLNLVPISVDDDGMAPADEDWRRMPPRLLYLTPSHQYPLGSVLSIERRLALIDAARRHGAWIIEDDYDSEFRHEGLPLPAVQGLSDDAPVVYLGTFSKTLFPALRLGFMVVPAGLTAAVSQALTALTRQGRVAEQWALADLIDSGAYTRHLRRMRRIYSERREALRESLMRYANRTMTMSRGAGGMHLSVRLSVALRDIDVCEAAAASGIAIVPLSEYSLKMDVAYPETMDSCNGFILGYSSMPSDQVDAYVQRLTDIIEHMLFLRKPLLKAS